jgi:hypothetical protein
VTDPIAKTCLGNPVYVAEVPEELRSCVARFRNPTPRGPLAQHLAERFPGPSVVVVRGCERFTRAFGIDRSGMMTPVNLYDALVPAEREKLREAGWMGREKRRR